MVYMILHICFGKKDSDLIAWKRSLPKQMFGYYVKSVLASEKNKTFCVIPVDFKYDNTENPIDVKVYITDKSLVQYVRAFSKNGISATVKYILRKHIEWNRLNTGYVAESEKASDIVVPLSDENDDIKGFLKKYRNDFLKPT